MYEIRTLDRSEVGLAFRRRIKGTNPDSGRRKQLDTPCKTIPLAKTNGEEQVADTVRGANEFYKQTNTAKLQELRESNEELKIDDLENNLSRSRAEEFDFTFLDYTDAHQIEKIEAYQLAGIIGRYSDYRTVPIQSELFWAAAKEDGTHGPGFQSLYAGTELFLQACHEHESEKPIMGAIPQLNLEQIDELINLYEQYNVFAFYLDFAWELPTVTDKAERVAFLHRRFANQRHHENVLLYGLNMRPGTHDDDVGYAQAATFAASLMGIDIIGENHSGPRWPEEVIEEIEKKKENSETVFRIYQRPLLGYLRPPISDLESHWPSNSSIDSEKVIQSVQNHSDSKYRYQSLVNSEQLEISFAQLRMALEVGKTSSLLQNRDADSVLLDPGEYVRREFESGLQSTIGEYT